MDVVQQSYSTDKVGLQDANQHSARRDVEMPEDWMVGSHLGCAFLTFCSEKYARTDYTPGHQLSATCGNRDNASFPYGQTFFQHNFYARTQDIILYFKHHDYF